MIKLILSVCVAISIGIGLAIALRPENPLESVYEGYNHIKIYEDGSYVGETKEGQFERGCILEAPCGD